MTTLQIGLVVVGAATAVFALAAGILASLERTPGVREVGHLGDSPSRAMAIPELIGALALIAAFVVSPATARPSGVTLVLILGGATALLVHAMSAFVRDARVRQRVGKCGLGLLSLSVVIAAYLSIRL